MPPASLLQTLRTRAELLAALRRFFSERGYLEVETPLLSPDVVVDTHLEPFATEWRSDPEGAGEELFLQTSPEFSHKRLLAAGSGPVFEVFRSFRNGERGQRHNPEFTLVEWYQPGDDHHRQMGLTETLLRRLAEAAEAPLASDRPFERLSYDEAFRRHAGTPVLGLETRELAEIARRENVSVPGELQPIAAARDEWLNLLLAELVEPHLGIGHPTFLYDYPASQAALAIIREDDPPVAERFELYIDGMELANGYHELRGAAELRRRNRQQNAKRIALRRRALPVESRLLAAMEAGLPPCAGVALGFDRLVMALLGKESIGEVRAFLTESNR